MPIQESSIPGTVVWARDEYTTARFDPLPEFPEHGVVVIMTDLGFTRNIVALGLGELEAVVAAVRSLRPPLRRSADVHAPHEERDL